jgi:hypothetical protein
MTSVLTSSQDWTEFVDFYGKAVKNGTLFEQTGSLPSQVPSRRMELICRGPIRYTGHGCAAAGDRRASLGAGGSLPGRRAERIRSDRRR